MFPTKHNNFRHYLAFTLPIQTLRIHQSALPQVHAPHYARFVYPDDMGQGVEIQPALVT
jgi:hypothetical protein